MFTNRTLYEVIQQDTIHNEEMPMPPPLSHHEKSKKYSGIRAPSALKFDSSDAGVDQLMAAVSAMDCAGVEDAESEEETKLGSELDMFLPVSVLSPIGTELLHQRLHLDAPPPSPIQSSVHAQKAFNLRPEGPTLESMMPVLFSQPFLGHGIRKRLATLTRKEGLPLPPPLERTKRRSDTLSSPDMEEGNNTASSEGTKILPVNKLFRL